ncbi:glutamate receptor ionotropic, delta-1-like [Argiope bruennichi]|uniref:glutamate receptor ionotropic, delta-1-like n=1 Tax=Argiope bruennichi TaxID=94029 RepID=UPI0024949C03|nr:glutamate receptor ionotropic, delta-1-like [Argiope bruennichi]
MKFPKYLKVATTTAGSSKVIETENGYIATGIDIKLLQLLAEKLNFEYTIFLPKDDGRYGILYENGSWTGVTGMLQRGEVDISTLYSPIIEERMPVLDFSLPYYTLEKTFATDLPHPQPNYTVLLRPFQLDVWIALATFLILPIILDKGVFQRQQLSKPFTNLFKRAPPEMRNSVKRRILYGSWLMFQTIARFVYTSVVLSFLTVRPMPKGIKTIPELAEAVRKGTFRFYVPAGSLNAEFLAQSDSEDFRTIGLAIQKNYWMEVLEYRNEKIGEGKAIEGARAIFHIKYGKPPFSTVSVADDSFGIWSAGVMIRKGFCCLENINMAILRINNGGLYQKILDDEAFQQQYKLFSRKLPDSGVRKLGLEELSGSFFLLMLGYIISFLILIIERIYNRCTREEMQP